MKAQPFIIFLKGITLETYKNIEDEFNDKLLENIPHTDSYVADKIIYDNIDPIFTSMDNWKRGSNIHCWTCDFTFSTISVFIPLNIKYADDEKWNISVYGNFCSFPCAMRHIIDYMNPELQNNLLELYNIFYDVKIYKIPPTPRRYNMCKYGGYMSEEMYLSNISKLSSSIDMGSNIQKEYINVNNKSFDNDDLYESSRDTM